MSITTTGGIAAAIGELEARHKHLLEELARVETAIAVLHDLRAPRLPLGVVTEPAAAAPLALPPAPPAVAPPAPAREVEEDLPPSVRRALQRGPLPPGDLVAQTRITRYELKRFVARGLLTATGVTRGRLVALPGHSAKEVP